MALNSFNTQATSNQSKPNQSQSYGSTGNFNTNLLNKQFGTNVQAPTTPTNQGTNPGLIHSTPTTPLKSLTTNPDGTTTSTYHPETTPNPAPLSTAGQAPGVLASGQQTTPEKTTFSGLVGQSQGPSQAYTDATGKYQQALKDLADYKTQLANTNKNISAEGISLSSSRGQEANVGQAASSILDALQQKVTEAEQGLGYANTQQGLQVQAGTAANTAAQNQAQRATQAGENVLSAVAPTGNIINVSPVTGLPIAGGSLNDLANTAGTISGIQSGAATAAATGGNIAAQQATTVAGYKSAMQQGQNLQAQLTDLITTFGLNPNDINVANKGIQAIASNVSDPHYKQLQNYVNDIANTYAQVLTPPGGSATDTSRGIATSMLDATASGTSIMDTMKSLDNAAQAKIAGVTTTNNTVTPSGGTTGGSKGIYDF